MEEKEKEMNGGDCDMAIKLLAADWGENHKIRLKKVSRVLFFLTLAPAHFLSQIFFGVLCFLGA